MSQAQQKQSDFWKQYEDLIDQLPGFADREKRIQAVRAALRKWNGLYESRGGRS